MMTGFTLYGQKYVDRDVYFGLGGFYLVWDKPISLKLRKILMQNSTPVPNTCIKKWVLGLCVEEFDWPAQSTDLIPVQHL